MDEFTLFIDKYSKYKDQYDKRQSKITDEVFFKQLKEFNPIQVEEVKINTRLSVSNIKKPEETLTELLSEFSDYNKESFELIFSRRTKHSINYENYTSQINDLYIKIIDCLNQENNAAQINAYIKRISGFTKDLTRKDDRTANSFVKNMITYTNAVVKLLTDNITDNKILSEYLYFLSNYSLDNYSLFIDHITRRYSGKEYVFDIGKLELIKKMVLLLYEKNEVLRTEGPEKNKSLQLFNNYYKLIQKILNVIFRIKPY